MRTEKATCVSTLHDDSDVEAAVQAYEDSRAMATFGTIGFANYLAEVVSGPYTLEAPKVPSFN
jgi:hypothetical protein